jgi:ACT domain-containing protein
MPRVVSQVEISAISDGKTLTIERDAIVTPLAAADARARGITIARAASDGSSPALIRQVTRQVVARMGDSSPEIVEAVVGEVVRAIANGEAQAELVEITPGVDFCAACLEQDRARSRHRAVLTTTGRNQKGIVARVTAKIAELSGDILDISQTLVGDYFTMIIVVDIASLAVPFADFKQVLEAEVKAMGLQAMIMHEDVVNSLHRV